VAGAGAASGARPARLCASGSATRPGRCSAAPSHSPARLPEAAATAAAAAAARADAASGARPARLRLWLGHATGQRLARRGSHSRGGRRRPSRGRIRRPPAAAVRLQLRHPARHMQRVRKHAAARPVRKQLMRVAGLVLMRAASSRRGRGERDASRRPRKHRGRRRRAGSQCEGLRPWHAGRVRCQRTGRAS